MLDNYPEILTIKEVCEILFIGRNLAYSLLENGNIKGFKVGRSWRIFKSSLLGMYH